MNLAAVEAMVEVAVDITAEAPEILTTEAVESSDVVITSGAHAFGGGGVATS